MSNQNDQEHTTFYDQADGKFDQSVQKERKLAKGVSEDEEEKKGDATKEVKENEEASLQDDSYSFDESNTDNEEYHDASGADDFDIDNDDDYVQ